MKLKEQIGSGASVARFGATDCLLYCTLSVAIVECVIPDVPVTVMV